MDNHQTADQINSPQVGQVKLEPSTSLITPPRTEFLNQEPPRATGRKVNPGCWDLPGLSGSREGVCRFVQSDPNCPQVDKDYICAKITALPAEFNHVQLHAYCHVEKGKWVFDMSLIPSKQLL